ncbi:MAG: AAA family ATPase [Bacilli bacterium]|nr:AAA family ATPase [Bacilli bacterium]
MAKLEAPKWQQDLDFFIRHKSGIILEGDISDLHPLEGEEDARLYGVDQILYEKLRGYGYHSVVFFNQVDGFYNRFDPDFEKEFKRFNKDVMDNDQGIGQAEGVGTTGMGQVEPQQTTQIGPGTFASLFTVNAGYDRGQSKFGGATEIIRRSMRNTQGAVAFVMELASRYTTRPDHLSDQEEYFYSELFLAVKDGEKGPGAQKDESGNQTFLPNVVILVVDKANDIPAWFYVGNQRIKSLVIAEPEKAFRAAYFEQRFEQSPEVAKMDPEEWKKMKNRFSSLTEGLKNCDIESICNIIEDKEDGYGLSSMEQAIHRFKFGVVKNPWTANESEVDPVNRLGSLDKDIRKRVKGQNHAVLQAEDIIKRSVLGFSGLQHSSSSNKPRGVMFLAGPTGVGKTELAKTLAEWLFGTEEALIRFDMSEFRDPASDQRLLGAAPGYIGYEEGGELTNAVKQHPFSILLFDEIEKAHPNIMDKFLQILEDGRLTDSHGDTVFFSDTLIIFTSNIGFSGKSAIVSEKKYDLKYEDWVVHPDPEHTYDAYRDEVLARVDYHFDHELGRKEIKNRIGENFIVFEYIDEKTAYEIMEKQLDGIISNAAGQDRHIEISFGDKAKQSLRVEIAKHLADGGRGVGNVIEKFVLNPISAHVAAELLAGREVSSLQIEDIKIEDSRGTLILE